MAELEPGQERTRERFESLISAASPVLDLILGVGERVSRFLEPNDYEYYPIRTVESEEGSHGVAAGPESDRDPASGPGSDSETGPSPESETGSDPESG